MTQHGIAPLPEGHEIMEHIVRSVIGEGGFGIVYRAEHPKLHITAAVKEFAPSRLAHRDESGALVPYPGKEALYAQILDRFDKTAAQLCALDHPNIVKVYNQRSDNNTSYVLMEYVTGETFGAWVQKRIGDLDHARLKEVLLPLLGAIEYLHARHLMHRDIAPDNILMRQDGVPILIDFGTLKQHVLGAETNLEGTEEDDPSAVVAKKFFSPPEQFSAHRKAELGSTADIYSLGATIYDALAGRAEDMTRHLVPATDRASSVVAPGGREMPPLHEVARVDLPRSFCDAVDAALSLSPRDRPQGIAAFRDLLFPEEAANRAPVQPPPSGRGARGATPDRATTEGGGSLRWGRLAGFGTVGALAIAAGAFVMIQPGDGNGDPAPPQTASVLQDDPQPGERDGEGDGADTAADQSQAPVALTVPQPAPVPSLDEELPDLAQASDPAPAPAQPPRQEQGPAPDATPGLEPAPAPPPAPASASPPPDFRLDLTRTVSGLAASGVVPPNLHAALEGIYGAEALGPDLRAVEGVDPPEGLDLTRVAGIVQDWSSFSLSAGPDGASLQGEPVSAENYFEVLDASGDAIELDLSFLTRTLPRADVMALIAHQDPCGTIMPLDLGAQLTPNDQLTLFGPVASARQGLELQRELILLLPGTLDGEALYPTSQALCDVSRAFDDLAGETPDAADAVRVAMDGDRAPLGQPVSHTDMPGFAVARDALPETGYLWSGLVMRGPDRGLVMLPLSQPSGDVEDLSLLSRGPGAPGDVALSAPPQEMPDLDLAFAPELALTFDAGDSYAMLLGLVLDGEISGLPALGSTAPEAGDYITRLEQALDESGVSILAHFQHPIAIE